MGINKILFNFLKWEMSGWSKGETPNSETLTAVLEILKQINDMENKLSESIDTQNS